MNTSQANKFLAEAGFPDLFLHKAEGVWYLLGDEGVVNHAVERCLHVCRLSDLTEQILRWKLAELAPVQEPNADPAEPDDSPSP